MEIRIPEFPLVLLIGPTRAGKTTFAQKHFRVSTLSRQTSYEMPSPMIRTSKAQRATRSKFCI